MKLTWLFAIVVVAPFVVISFYNHPIGDAYCCTTLVRKYGYWEAQLRLYDTVPPRYTELALSSLTPLSFGNFWGYKIIPVGFIFIFVFLMRWLLSVLTRNKMSNSDYYLLSIIFTGTYLAVLPGIGEGIYWASALSVYHTGIVLFIIWSILLFKWFCDNNHKWYIFLGSCLTLAGIIGCNEIIAIISFFVLIGIGVRKAVNKQNPDSLWFMMVAITFLCFIIIVNFKGVSNRYNLVQTDNSGEMLYAFGMSILGAGYYGFKCLINPFFWLGVLLSTSFPKFAALFYDHYRRLFDLKKYFFSLWGLTIVSIFFIIIFLSGLKPPLRISNMAVFFFLFGLIYILPSALTRLPTNTLQRVGRYRNALAFALLVIGFTTKNNVSVASIEVLSGTASHYDKEMNERYKIIERCKGDTCKVPPLRSIPVTLRYSVEDRDPHISEYFNKTIIVSGK